MNCSTAAGGEEGERREREREIKRSLRHYHYYYLKQQKRHIASFTKFLYVPDTRPLLSPSLDGRTSILRFAARALLIDRQLLSTPHKSRFAALKL